MALLGRKAGSCAISFLTFGDLLVGFCGVLRSPHLFYCLNKPHCSWRDFASCPLPPCPPTSALSGTWHWLYLEHHRRGLRRGEVGRPGTEWMKSSNTKGPGSWGRGGRPTGSGRRNWERAVQKDQRHAPNVWHVPGLAPSAWDRLLHQSLTEVLLGKVLSPSSPY